MAARTCASLRRICEPAFETGTNWSMVSTPWRHSERGVQYETGTSPADSGQVQLEAASAEFDIRQRHEQKMQLKIKNAATFPRPKDTRGVIDISTSPLHVIEKLSILDAQTRPGGTVNAQVGCCVKCRRNCWETFKNPEIATQNMSMRG